MMNRLWREKPPTLKALMRNRLVVWRRERSIEREERPIRLDRARQLGYRTKQGYIVLRVKVRRGGFQKPRPRAGRRPKASGVVRHKVNVSMKEEALNRVRRRYPNLQPLGAYPLADDSLYRWFEVVAIDSHHPAVVSDRNISLGPKVS